jgi:lysophospholipase L1-like esterase
LCGAVLAAFTIALAPVAGAASSGGSLDLSRIVVVGDSLTAGFQNFSLFDGNSPGAPMGGQEFGYPALVAQQAGVTLPLPLISYPGLPPALTLSGGQIVRAAGIGVRELPFLQPLNLSVPGFNVADALAHPFPGDPIHNPIDLLSDAVLGAPNPAVAGCGPLLSGSAFIVSEVQCAAALRPSMIIVGIGNNDALQALTTGAPPTPVPDFRSQYHRLTATLAATGAPVVIANVPDVTALPFLISASAFAAKCGFMPPGATLADFVVPDITNFGAASLDLCSNYKVRPAWLVAAAQAAVESYNNVIKDEAKAVGATVADIHKLFAHIARHGYRLESGRTLTADFGGGLFSLDGIHPTNTGQAVLANEVIKTINTAFHASIPAISVEAVAQSDPLVPKP